jgi:hypothetical protein
MQASKQSHIDTIFEQFRQAIGSVEWMVQFWGNFLKHSLDEYLAREKSRTVFEAIFTAYNIPVSGGQHSWLWSAPRDPFSLGTDEMEGYRKQFFQMAMNLGYVKAYNTLEILLFQATLVAYFPNNILRKGKDSTKLSDGLIKKAFRENSSIGSLETKNNRHLISYLKYQSPDYTMFMQQAVRTDLKTNWDQFFEMMAIIRSVNVHHGGLMTRDVLNELQSFAKDVFLRFFDFSEGDDAFLILQPKEGDPFLNVITLFKDLAVNSMKFIFGEADPSFLGLNRC